MSENEDPVRAEELRIHALGAAISRREWSEVERAHAAIRDEFHQRIRKVAEPPPARPLVSLTDEERAAIVATFGSRPWKEA